MAIVLSRQRAVGGRQKRQSVLVFSAYCLLPTAYSPSKQINPRILIQHDDRALPVAGRRSPQSSVLSPPYAKISCNPAFVTKSVRFRSRSQTLSCWIVVSVVRSRLRADFSSDSLRPSRASRQLRSMPSAL